MICTRRHVRLTCDDPLTRTTVARTTFTAHTYDANEVIDVKGVFTDKDVSTIVDVISLIESKLVLTVHREMLEGSYVLKIAKINVRDIIGLHEQFEWSPNSESIGCKVSTGYIDVFCDRIYVTLHGESTPEDAWRQVVKLVGYTRDLDKAIHRHQCAVLFQVLPRDLVACVFAFT